MLYPGLVTLDQMKAKQEDMVKERVNQLAQRDKSATLTKAERKLQKAKEKAKV